MLDGFIFNDASISNYQKLNDTILYLEYINNDDNIVAVNPDEAYRYQGNLFGLFTALNVDVTTHFHMLYLNGYTNPTQYKGDKLTFKVPNANIINYLNNLYNE